MFPADDDVSQLTTGLWPLDQLVMYRPGEKLTVQDELQLPVTELTYATWV